MPSVTVIEFGVGNIHSVINALKRVDCDPKIAHDGDELKAQNPDKIVLPGVGAIGGAMSGLKDRGVIPVLNDFVLEQKKPLLGICVGMQILAETCEEFGSYETLGYIPGAVKKIEPLDSKLRVPHVGWNVVDAVREDALLSPVTGEHFYFVHSCAMQCDEDYVIGRCEYGGSVICAVRRDNIRGIQFHPEKSSGNGEAVLSAFVHE